MSKKLRCKVESSDWVKVTKASGEDIAVQVMVRGKYTNIFITPKNAKKLRKQIKSALAEIEWDDGQDDQEKEEPAYIPHVGEVVEVYRNTTGHGFRIGEDVRVLIVNGRLVKAEFLGGSAAWWVGGDIRPIQNWKPKEGEKVLVVDSTLIPSDTTRSWVGKFGNIYFDAKDGQYGVYNEDKSDWFGFHASDLRPAE